MSTGGHARNRGDTEGHTVVPVRDREAPVSNPWPPTKIVFKSRSSPAPSGARGSQTFLELGDGTPVQVDFES